MLRTEMISSQEGERESAVFVSAVGSPSSARLSLTPSVEWLDAYSEIIAADGNEIVTLAEDEIDQIDGDPGSYIHDGSAARRRSSRGQQSHRSHRRIPSDLSDLDFPKLDLLYGPHLRFLHEEVGKRIRDIWVRSDCLDAGATPDENDLFPSTPLDEDQLHNADLKLKEELGSVVINEIEDQQDLAWSDIPWTDPRWLDPRPLVYNAAENAEVFAMSVWHKFQSWKVVGFSNLPQFLQVQETEIFSILIRLFSG